MTKVAHYVGNTVPFDTPLDFINNTLLYFTPETSLPASLHRQALFHIKPNTCTVENENTTFHKSL
jgi:hypothetical protein